MNQIHPNISLVPLLQRMAVGDLHYHLFTLPNTEPTLAAVLADFTEEAGTGYAVVTVALADFTTTGVAGNQGYIIAGNIAFTPGAATTFTDYGYYITDDTDAILLAFGFFDAGPIVTVNPATLVLTPKLGNNSKYAA